MIQKVSKEFWAKFGLSLATSIGIEDYLILLSLLKTCEFRGINFLKFLLSKERNIDDYQKNYTSQGNKRKIK
jgi:hypothetical protein